MTNEMPLQALYNETLMSLAKGQPIHKAVADLIGKGVPETNARMIVQEAERQKHAIFRQEGLKAAGKGAIWFAVGLAVTVISANAGGSTYLVFWGPMVFGGWMVIKGLFRAMVG
jgi:hypothetical protein